MFRSFTALALGAALAVTGFASQARAGNDDLTKALIGLAVIGGIAIAIDNRNDRRDARREAARKRLPEQCLRRFNSGRRAEYGFGERCLNNHAAQVTPPEHCARRGRNRRGNRVTYFPEHCLLNDGYTVVSR